MSEKLPSVLERSAHAPIPLWQRLFTEPKFLIALVGGVGIAGMGLWTFWPAPSLDERMTAGSGDSFRRARAHFADAAGALAAAPKELQPRRLRGSLDVIPMEAASSAGQKGGPISASAAAAAAAPSGPSAPAALANVASAAEQVPDSSAAQQQFQEQSFQSERVGGSMGSGGGGSAGSSAVGGGPGASMDGAAAAGGFMEAAALGGTRGPAGGAGAKARGQMAAFKQGALKSGAVGGGGAGNKTGVTGTTAASAVSSGEQGGSGPEQTLYAAAGPVGAPATGGGPGAASAAGAPSAGAARSNGSSGQGGGPMMTGGQRGQEEEKDFTPQAEIEEARQGLLNQATNLMTQAAKPGVREIGRLTSLYAARVGQAVDAMNDFDQQAVGDADYFTNTYTELPDLGEAFREVKEGVNGDGPNDDDAIMVRLRFNRDQLQEASGCLARLAGQTKMPFNGPNAVECHRKAEAGLGQGEMDANKITSLRDEVLNQISGPIGQLSTWCNDTDRTQDQRNKDCAARNRLNSSRGVYQSRADQAAQKLGRMFDQADRTALGRLPDIIIERRARIRDLKRRLEGMTLPGSPDLAVMHQRLADSVNKLDLAQSWYKNALDPASTIKYERRAAELAAASEKATDGLSDAREAAKRLEFVKTQAAPGSAEQRERARREAEERQRREQEAEERRTACLERCEAMPTRNQFERLAAQRCERRCGQ